MENQIYALKAYPYKWERDKGTFVKRKITVCEVGRHWLMREMYPRKIEYEVP